jgi:integrase
MPKRSETTLTAAFCRSAKPGVRITPSGPELVRASYPDHDVRGLELRVAASGDKSWTFRYRDRVTSKQSRLTIGLFNPSVDAPADEPAETRRLTLQGARVASRLLRSRVDAGEDPAGDRRQAKGQAKAQTIRTMTDLADVYFSACETGTHRSGKRRKKAASTLNGERWLWGKYLEPRLGAEEVDRINRAGLKSLLRTVYGMAPSQANKCRALLSQFFNFAVDEERIASNPVSRVAKLTEDKARTRTLTAKELKAVWSALDDTSGLRIVDEKRDVPVLISRAVAVGMKLCLVTLQRRAEVAGMKRGELDLAKKTWIIPEDRTKGRAEHLIPLSDLAVALIEEALEIQAGSKKGLGEAVFASPRDKDISIDAGALSHAMADLTAALQIQDATLHDLRRTGATNLAALRVPPFVISKVLAHKDSGGGAAVTARHYNLYAYADEKRDALQLWSEHLAELVGYGDKGAGIRSAA